MRIDKPKTGFTLVELLTVVSIILLLAVIGLPAAKQVLDSFESSLSVRYLISAALGNARAIAARQQAYAGLRFQQDLAGNQYMIFIILEEPGNMGGLTIGFRAVVGHKPMRLPANVGVMDLMVRLNYGEEPEDAQEVGDEPIDDSDLDNTVPANLVDGRNIYLTDTTSFSIVFSPSGKLVIHQVRVRNRDGEFRPEGNQSLDNVFNGHENVRDNEQGMFIQDDYANLGLGAELSRNNFIIYDKRDLDSVNTDSRWTDYLQSLEVLYISPYTGRIINK
jgi:prepilin-type N-terminal cleavage/methylation domain-containing protein